jgi:hypothetical protein
MRAKSYEVTSFPETLMEQAKCSPNTGGIIMGRLATATANRLQRVYENHRVPETWGSTRISGYVFDALRREGFWAALKELMRRVRHVSHPEFSTGQKLTALLAGVTMVTLADILIRDMRPAVKAYGRRTFGASTPRLLVTLYVIGATLLVAANGGGSGPISYPDSDESTDYRAYSRPDETDGQHGFYDTDAWDEWDRHDDSSPSRNELTV